MEPIGTITMCFPHVDKETRSILQSLMEISTNFADFTEKLCDKACTEVSLPPLLEYLAVYFASRLDWYTLIDRLESTGKVPDLARHLLLLSKVRRGEAINWDEMKNSVKHALVAAPNDWIVAHLYLNWRGLAEEYYPDTDLEIQPIEAITSSLEKSNEMACFKSYLLYFKARKYEREGRNNEAVNLYRQAVVTSREFDDQILNAYVMVLFASNIKRTDAKQAIDLFISARELSEKLGYRHGVGLVLEELGFIMQYRGELSAAIEYLRDYSMIRIQLGMTAQLPNFLVASLYNQFGKGEEAYQYAKAAVDFSQASFEVRKSPRMHAELAWALINLGRYEEANTELATAYKSASKSGDSIYMMWVRMVDGILDKAEKHFDSAYSIFKEILKDLESNPIPVLQNICLLNLTEIEIQMLTDKSLKKDSDLSGLWMKKLIEHAHENDLPGIAARALLLKAELRRRQGRFDDLRMLLKQVQKTARAPSMKYLNDLLVSAFPDIVLT